MDDLISRAAAIDALTNTNLKRNVDTVCDGDMNRTRRAAQRVIAQMPAVDAVPVVRCKDCGYFQANNAEEGDWSGRCTNVYVPMNGTTVDGWWFCADGKREG